MSLTLDLAGNPITGGGDLVTARASSTGAITLTNVGAVTLGAIDTNTGTGNYAAGNVYIGTSTSDRTGAVSLAALNVYQLGGSSGGSSPYGVRSGAVGIYSTGAVSITGGIDMRGRYVGYLTVDHVGQFSTGVINNTAAQFKSGFYTSRELSFNGGDGSGSFTATAILGTSGGSTGSAAGVSIRNYSGVSVVPGSGNAIDLGGLAAYATGTTRIDQITVKDIGTGGVAIGNLTNYCVGGTQNVYSGNVVIGNVAGGGLIVGSIDASNGSASYGRAGGNVSIYNVVGDATVGAVSTEGLRPLTYQTGDLRIGYRVTATDAAGYATADTPDYVYGNITISGAVNLNSAHSNTYDGILKLATSGVGTTINLASLDMTLVKTATFMPDKYAYVQSMSGGTASNIISTAGKKVLYGGGGTDITALSSGGYLVPNFGNMTADDSNNPLVFGTSVSARVNGTVGYDGLRATVTAVSGSGGAGDLDTVAIILYGTPDSEKDITTAWRTRTLGEAATLLVSDVLNLTDTGSDVYVLQMDYDEVAVTGLGYDEATLAAAGGLYVGWYSGTAWVNAGAGAPVLGAWDGSYTTAGEWGVDTTKDVAWVVLNHASQFAVVAQEIVILPVAEPGSAALLALGLLALKRRRRS